MARPFRRFRDSPEFDSLDFLSEEQRKKAVLVVAHPDDEIFCSGMLLRLAELGTHTKVVCLTRGEGGPTGAYRREELGKVRQQEMEMSCKVLNVNELKFLNHVDPVAEGNRVFAPSVSVAQLTSQLRGEIKDANIVISHGSCGEYWHPAHLLVFASVKRAVSVPGNQAVWMTMLARQPGHPIQSLVNWDDEAHLSLDVSQFADQRSAALECHQSQKKLFDQFAAEADGEFIAGTGRENYCIRKT